MQKAKRAAQPFGGITSMFFDSFSILLSSVKRQLSPLNLLLYSYSPLHLEKSDTMLSKFLPETSCVAPSSSGQYVIMDQQLYLFNISSFLV